MTIQSITDLSEDQENERYNRLKKSLPKLAAASLAIALAVYFSYSSSPWRYALIVVLASAAVLLIAGAIMARPVKIEESSHTIDLNLITDSIRNSINESNERMHRIMNEEATRNLIDRNLITDSIRNSINESNERMRLIMNEEAIRNLEYERSRDFLREYNLEYNPHIYNFRASDFILREVIQRGNKLHELTSKSGIEMFLRSDNRLVQMEEILSGNNRFYTHDIVKRMVNERDHNGNTPLHNAVRSEFLPAIRLLFEHGADCFIQNKKGQTPYELSSKSDLVQDLFQNCSSVKEKIKEQREQQYSHNINKLLNIPQIKSKLCKNEKPYRKVPNCEGACSTLQELSVNKILDSCCLGG